MRMSQTDSKINLEGSWTLAGMTFTKVDSLAANLENVINCADENLQIDCSKIDEVDASGLLLLNIWLRCLQLGRKSPVTELLAAAASKESLC